MAFANARRLDPSSWGATLALGEVKRLQGDYTTAEQMFREVLAHDPKSTAALSSYRTPCESLPKQIAVVGMRGDYYWVGGLVQGFYAAL